MFKGQSFRYSSGQSNPLSFILSLYVGELSEREQFHLLASCPAFSHIPPLPTSELSPSIADSWVGGFVLGSLGSLQQIFLWDREFFPLPQSPKVFEARGFVALFPHAGTLGCAVCLTPQLFLPVYPHTNVGLPATTSLRVLSCQAACLCSSYQSGWMFLL